MMVELVYRGPLLAGVDEAGRGPLAGNVVAAAVILDPKRPIDCLADSKTLSPGKREQLAREIKAASLAWSIAAATVEEIDQLNIFQATMLAMRRAVEGLAREPEFVAVDGNKLPGWRYPSQAIVKGDSKIPAISAASIIAKVARDEEMDILDARFPGYGFARHKGYGTVAHRRAIADLGPSPYHRRSFEPVKSHLAKLNKIDR